MPTKAKKQTNKKVAKVAPKVATKVAPKVATKVEEPVVEDTAPAAPVTADPAAPVTADPAVQELFDYSSEISELQTQLKAASTIIKDLIVHTNKLEKRLNKDKKVVDKKMKGKPRRTGENKAINGFSKPGPVSDELRKFLSMTKEDLIARTEVTKRITCYCKEHGLQNEADKRIILPDTKLRKLLKVKQADELTYFNLQKYMKIHFPNKEGIYPTNP